MSCAADMGVAVAGEAAITTNDEATAALIPVAGIENITRDDLAAGVVVAVFTASGPPSAEAPSGAFRVFVQAAAGSTHGEAQIIDAAGTVVQTWEIEVDVDPHAQMPTAAEGGGPTSARAPRGGTLDLPGPLSPESPDAWHFYYPGCPWYYPYLAPYYFHFYPAYKYGCHYWYYRWWWGRLHFHYCWWPSRYCHRCCCWW